MINTHLYTIYDSNETTTIDHFYINDIDYFGKGISIYFFCYNFQIFRISRKRRVEERRGWAWVAGESTPEPRRTTKGKKGKN
jgi:hypothetical protein